MRTIPQIEELLQELDNCIADELEDQDLDFKQWDTSSRDKAVQSVERMAAHGQRRNKSHSVDADLPGPYVT